MFTLTKYCSFALMHCSCPMNSARVTGKKIREKNTDVKRMKRQSKKLLVSQNINLTILTPHFTIHLTSNLLFLHTTY